MDQVGAGVELYIRAIGWAFFCFLCTSAIAHESRPLFREEVTIRADQRNAYPNGRGRGGRPLAPVGREVATIGESSPSLPNYLGMKMRVHISPVNRNALSQAGRIEGIFEGVVR